MNSFFNDDELKIIEKIQSICDYTKFLQIAIKIILSDMIKNNANTDTEMIKAIDIETFKEYSLLFKIKDISNKSIN